MTKLHGRRQDSSNKMFLIFSKPMIVCRLCFFKSQRDWDRHDESAAKVHRIAQGRAPRFCIDCRALNRITQGDSYPIPSLEAVLRDLSGYNFYCCFDLKSGYWQIPIREQDRHKTAFVCKFGLFAWRAMPFGPLQLVFKELLISLAINGVLLKLLQKQNQKKKLLRWEPTLIIFLLDHMQWLGWYYCFVQFVSRAEAQTLS